MYCGAVWRETGPYLWTYVLRTVLVYAVMLTNTMLLVSPFLHALVTHSPFWYTEFYSSHLPAHLLNSNVLFPVW